MQLSFIQSNWLRQYPFRAECGQLDLNGTVVPRDILVGLRLSITGSLDVYVSKIITNGGYISVEFCSGEGFVGVANSRLTNDNEAILVKNASGVIGTVTIGNTDSCEANQLFQFDSTSGKVEPSTLTPVAAPAVKSITIKGKALTGNLTLASSTVGILDAGESEIYLSVLVPSTVASRQDKQARFLTCDKPVVGGINGVVPDSNGNIDIYTIAPLSISAGVLSITVPDGSSLCQVYNIPPNNQVSTNSTPLSDAAKEYPTWAQFD